MTSGLGSSPGGGRFDFDDGGTFCGGWEDGKAHGHGVCTGPKGRGEYSGAWAQGLEVSGVYVWPQGGAYEGQWGGGKRHGLGVETRGHWVYRGEWTDGLKGRYGVRQSISSGARYDGTWANGLPDGYGSETYADGGTFQGQWAKGMRHGYGVRSSAPFGLAARRRPSLLGPDSEAAEGVPTGPELRPEDCRGGFVLKDLPSRDTGTWGRSLPAHDTKRAALKNLVSKTKRRSSFEDPSDGSDSDATESSFMVQDEVIDGNVIETYMGEWKNDKRCGFGIAERSDGIKYAGEWYNNKKFGYGLTTYKNGLEEYGKYKNNLLLMSGGKKGLFLLRSAKFRGRVEAAVNTAHRASQIALQKADIAISRTATARGKAEQADKAAKHAREDSQIARMVAKQYAPEFHQPGTGFLRRKFASSQDSTEFGQHVASSDSPRRSLLAPSPAGDFSRSEFDEARPPPAQSALLDVFRNTSDRRPSAAGFLRRPSAVNFHRRPSTVVELKYVPSSIEQEFIPNNPAAAAAHNYNHPQQPLLAAAHNYNRPQQQQPLLNLQQVVDDHHNHYYQTNPESSSNPRVKKKKPGIDLTELSKIYGIPLSRPLSMDDDEGSSSFLPQRRSTMPNVLDGSTDTEASSGEVFVRTGSLYSATRKMEAQSKTSSVASVRKNSLPDISSIGAAAESKLLSREAIAILSSQRREAIRRQEEEAMRLRANPLLYLFSPEIWDWLASQQLVILIIVINVALGILLFKVIL